jgi:multiphosphoryl transfer protein
VESRAGMIGLVIVSHSQRLAEGVCELASQVAQGKVRLAAAGGTSDVENPIGTDAFKIQQAIEAVAGEDGVLVFTDLGSAVLSAETALELLDGATRARVRLCDAPLVEGAVAAASLAAAGAGMDEIVSEVEAAKPAPGQVEMGAAEEKTVRLPNRLGLHARPAARLIRLTRQFEARVTVENRTAGSGAADAGSLNAVLGLGARQGHDLKIRAQGREARKAVEAIAAFLESGCGDPAGAAQEPAMVRADAAGGQLGGIAASAGIAVGPLRRLQPATVQHARLEAEDPEAEHQRLRAAIRGAGEETEALRQWALAHAGESEAGIFEAQTLFLEDPALVEAAERIIAGEHATAESAWERASAEVIGRFHALEDPYLSARAADVADVAARVARELTGAVEAAALAAPAIVAALDLTPSQVKRLDPALTLGICLQAGGASSHAIILARAMGIPAVTGLGPVLETLAEGTRLALDGERGLVWVSPEPEELRKLETRRERWLESRSAADSARQQPAATRDGRPIRVFANIGSVEGAAEAIDRGAEGVGVLRTEFLFLGRAAAPTEEEQFAVYQEIAGTLGNRPLVIRTLDAGGDKPLPYIDIGAEANPFLGWRGIRLTLDRRDLLLTQLRAILRVARGHAVEILFPMISSLSEMRAAKAALEEAAAGLGCAAIKAGAMIETPAAVMIADRLAREAAFFSIGTNDLAQYMMSADRTNARVARAADALEPAVLRGIELAIRAGREAGIPVTLCGELAADPLATPLLLGLGLQEFSVSAPLIPALKRAIRSWNVSEAEAVARRALELDACDAVRKYLLGLREA